MPTRTGTRRARSRSIPTEPADRAHPGSVSRGFIRGAAIVCTAVCFSLTAQAAGEGDAWLSSHYADHPLVGTVWTGNGQQSSLEELTDAAVSADFVLLGEIHPNPDHHRLQARVLKAIVEAGRRPALVFEMIPARYQAVLDEFSAAKPENAGELGAKVEWEDRGWPDWRIYQPVADVAVSAGLPLVAGDIDRTMMRKIGMEGRAALTGEQMAGLFLADDLAPALDDRLKETLRESHCNLLPEAAIAPMVLVQRARGGAMARAMLDDATTGDDGAVLIAGAGHARTDFGVPAIIRGQRPDATIVSVSMVAVHPDLKRPDDYGRLAEHDFVLFTPREDITDHCAAMSESMKSKSGTR